MSNSVRIVGYRDRAHLAGGEYAKHCWKRYEGDGEARTTIQETSRCDLEGIMSGHKWGGEGESVDGL